MIHRVIDTIRHINSHSGFEAYLENIQRNDKPGNASVNEAKRDYSAVIRRDTNSFLF